MPTLSRTRAGATNKKPSVFRRTALRSGLESAVGADEFGDFRRHDFAPAAAREDAVVTALGRDEMLLLVLGNAAAQVMRCLGLAGARNVVQFAFDREQRNRFDVVRTHQLAFDFPGAARQPEFL